MGKIGKTFLYVTAWMLCLDFAGSPWAWAAHSNTPKTTPPPKPGVVAPIPDPSLYRISDAASISEYNHSIYSDPPPSLAYGTYKPTYVAPASPPPTYIDQQAGTYCRQYSRQTRAFGHAQENYGVACLQPDGSWRVTQ